MNQKLKQWFRAFLTLNKSQQRGIIILSVFVVTLLVINYFLPTFFQYTTNDISNFQKEIESFRQQQQQISDSINIDNLQNRGELTPGLAREKLHPFLFNPNDLPEESWKKMGLTDKQIRIIKNYEAKGGRFYRKEDLKKMYCISDAEYQVLMPFIRIPSGFMTLSEDIVENDRPPRKKKKRKKERFKMVELNSADSAELVKNLRIPPWLARRTIKYRNLIGGFYEIGQLVSVYGFDSSRMEKLQKYIMIDPSAIKTININTGSFNEISGHLYFSARIAREIINRRLENGKFTSKQQLVDDGIVSESLFLKIKHYISLE